MRKRPNASVVVLLALTACSDPASDPPPAADGGPTGDAQVHQDQQTSSSPDGAAIVDGVPGARRLVPQVRPAAVKS